MGLIVGFNKHCALYLTKQGGRKWMELLLTQSGVSVPPFPLLGHPHNAQNRLFRLWVLYEYESQTNSI